MMLISCALFLFVFLVGTLRATAAPQTEATAYILIIDHSASMYQKPEESDPQNIRLDAATLVIDSARPGDQIAVINFAADSQVLQPLIAVNESNKEELCKKIHAVAKVNPNGTDIVGAITNAVSLVEASLRSGIHPKIVLLTDGHMEAYQGLDTRGQPKPKYADENAAIKAALKPIRDQNVKVDCVALGKQANTEFFRTIAVETLGSYYMVNSGEELLSVYLDILSADKGMLRIQNPNFYVWPGAQEINVVLFKNDQQARLSTVQTQDASYAPGGANTYWSRTRGNPPRFYDFLRVTQPHDGNWQVQAEPKSSRPKIYVLQSAPFEFNAVSPQGGKQLLGQPCRFTAEITPKNGINSDIIEPILAKAVVNVRLQLPNGQSSTFDLEARNRTLSAERTLEVEGDYIADFVASFGDLGESAWLLKATKIFRVGPPDFSIELNQPKNGFVVPNPVSNLLISGGFEKRDPKCQINAPPEDAKILAEVLQGEKICATYPLERMAEGFRTNVSNITNPVLEPGMYSLKISATSSGYTFSPAHVSFEIGPYPTPVDLGFSASITNAGEGTPEVGQAAALEAVLLDRSGHPTRCGDIIGTNWRIEAVEFHLQRSDKLSQNVTFTNIFLPQISGGNEAGRFEFPIIASGTNRVSGRAHIQLAYIFDGKKRCAREMEVEVAPWTMLLDLVRKFSVSPLSVRFSKPVKVGERTTSQEFEIENSGETDLDLTAELHDLHLVGNYQASGKLVPVDQAADTPEIPRGFVSLINENAAAVSRSFKFILSPGIRKKLSVMVDIPAGLGEMRELLPSGKYQGEITISSAGTTISSRSKETAVTIEMERQ